MCIPTPLLRGDRCCSSAIPRDVAGPRLDADNAEGDRNLSVVLSIALPLLGVVLLRIRSAIPLAS
jgi:hypothetical protein